MADTGRLATRVQSLPPELFDEIYALTFTPTSDTVVITKKYRPPKLLQVDRASRNLFAEHYYAQTKFTATDMDVVVHWLRSLRDEHLKLLTDVRLLTVRKSEYWFDLAEFDLMGLAETVCSGAYGSDLRIHDCDFLRVQDQTTGVLTDAITTVEFYSWCGTHDCRFSQDSEYQTNVSLREWQAQTQAHQCARTRIDVRMLSAQFVLEVLEG